MIVEHRAMPLPATEALARELSLWARPGLAIHLSGDLGAGKSTFARAFIRALAVDDGEFDIPSPSFSLVQTYDAIRVPVIHADLYRLQAESEADELGLEELLENRLMLVEWPEKLPGFPQPDCLRIFFSGSGNARDLRLEASGKWADALARNALISRFIDESGLAGATRFFFEGDASARRYERIETGTSKALLMDMPSRPDGPIVKDGRSYSEIAHLAEGIASVVAVNDYLFSLGYSASKIHRADIAHGLALIEPLGSNVFGRMIARGDDMREPMKAAVEVLADMAKRNWPGSVPAREAPRCQLAEYDLGAMMIEVDLLPSWFWPLQRKSEAGSDIRNDFAAAWQAILPGVRPEHPVWTLRDYHSPNLLWLPERQGLGRVGIIDTQDCVLGHPAYDLVSLLQDARVDIDAGLAGELYDHYCGLRAAAGPFDAREFSRAVAILGAQRATKILGIFARLSKRDGKHVYLGHIPRVLRHLKTNLSHPALAALKTWYARNLLLEGAGP